MNPLILFMAFNPKFILDLFFETFFGLYKPSNTFKQQNIK